jgi:hypothetical protein
LEQNGVAALIEGILSTRILLMKWWRSLLAMASLGSSASTWSINDTILSRMTRSGLLQLGLARQVPKLGHQLQESLEDGFRICAAADD